MASDNLDVSVEETECTESSSTAGDTNESGDVQQDADNDETGLSYEYWVALFKTHPILASKARSSEANNAKKRARFDIMKTIKDEKNLSVTDSQVRKAFNNRKSRLLSKSDANKTGNNPVMLSKEEKLFHDYLFNADGGMENPASNKIPGAIDIGPRSRASSFDSEEIADILNRELSEIDQPSRSSSVSPATLMTGLNVVCESSEQSSTPGSGKWKLKRPPAPPQPSTSSKRLKEDKLRTDLMYEQYQYYKNLNHCTTTEAANAEKLKLLEGQVKSLSDSIAYIENCIQTIIDTDAR